MTTDRAPTLRDDLRQTVVTVLEVNQRLEAVIGVPTSRSRDEAKRGRVDHSQPPWNAVVAHLITDLHARSRELERDLRDLAGLSLLYRGGSSDNTRVALEAMLNVAEAVEDRDVSVVLNWLDSWVCRAQVALGTRDQPRRLPRQPQSTEPRCPYCLSHTLRFWASRGEVRCVNPSCVDETGRRPAALMEYSAVAMDWVLAWRDGGVGVAA